MYIINKEFLKVLRENCEEESYNVKRCIGVTWASGEASKRLRRAMKILRPFQHYGKFFRMKISIDKYPEVLDDDDEDYCRYMDFIYKDNKVSINLDDFTIERIEEAIEYMRKCDPLKTNPYEINKIFFQRLDEYFREDIARSQGWRGILEEKTALHERIMDIFKKYAEELGVSISKYSGRVYKNECCTLLNFEFKGEIQTIKLRNKIARCLKNLLDDNKHRLSVSKLNND